MSQIDIMIGNLQYKISCKEEEKQRISYLASLVNKRLDKISKKSKNIDDNNLLVMTALMIEDELDRKSSLGIFSDEETDDESLFNDQDIYDSISQNTDNIAEYIEKLAKKVKNY